MLNTVFCYRPLLSLQEQLFCICNRAASVKMLVTGKRDLGCCMSSERQKKKKRQAESEETQE